MILFVHGFGSCGWGAKSLLLRQHFGIERVIAPDLPFDPDSAITKLHDLIERYDVGALVGSSLGGFYVTALNATRPLPSILINPVVRPHELLADYLGLQHRWCDGAPFHVGDAFLEVLRRLYRPRLDPGERYLVLLQQADEVLDYRQAADYYRGKDVVEIPGGSHRFERLDDQLPRITDWLAETAGQPLAPARAS